MHVQKLVMVETLKAFRVTIILRVSKLMCILFFINDESLQVRRCGPRGRFLQGRATSGQQPNYAFSVVETFHSFFIGIIKCFVNKAFEVEDVVEDAAEVSSAVFA